MLTLKASRAAMTQPLTTPLPKIDMSPKSILSMNTNRSISTCPLKSVPRGSSCYPKGFLSFSSMTSFSHSSAYIFNSNELSGTLGRIIFIHLLRSTLTICLAISDCLARHWHLSLHRFCPILLRQPYLPKSKNPIPKWRVDPGMAIPSFLQTVPFYYALYVSSCAE